jgi:ribose 1,5-bisphosphokinase PhnN
VSDSGAVLVTGASAAGKSRLLDGVVRISRDSGVLTDVRVADRFTTRRVRAKETHPSENRFLARDAFNRGVSSGTINVSWSRPISQVAENHYGFALGSEMLGDGLVVLSANNYLRWPEHEPLRDLRRAGRLIVVRIWASPATRLARLRGRRPPLEGPELELRMRDVPPDELPPADYVIPNDPAFQALAEWEFVRLLTSFRFAMRSPTGLEFTSTKS